MNCNRIHIVSRAQMNRLAFMRPVLRKAPRKAPAKRWRCAECGGFVTHDYADLHPATTTSERVK